MEKPNNAEFEELHDKISPETLKAIKAMGFIQMTDIQAAVLPKALDNEDIVATAKTGSGKTLSFLIPVIETVLKSMELKVQGLCTYRATSNI